jgi:hypothetical protein
VLLLRIGDEIMTIHMRRKDEMKAKKKSKKKGKKKKK